jgi:hypothetical protein
LIVCNLLVSSGTSGCYSCSKFGISWVVVVDAIRGSKELEQSLPSSVLSEKWHAEKVTKTQADGCLTVEATYEAQRMQQWQHFHNRCH